MCLIAPHASAQMPPAGTDITNQALADYTDGASQRTTVSNIVTSGVLPVYTIALSPPGTVAAPAFTLSGAGGDTLYCAFDLTNMGNARDSVDVWYRLVPPSNATIDRMIFFDDGNGNGRFDPGEDDPSFLAIDRAATANMDAAVILPAGAFGGQVFVEIRARSAIDTTTQVQTSVIRVTNTDPPQMTIHLGPEGNARALPGGEGSNDDLTVGYLDYVASSFTFENDVLNEGAGPDFYEVGLADSVTLPVGVRILFADSTGQRLPQSPSSSSAFFLGLVDAGETRSLQVLVSSASGSLHSLVNQPIALRIRARSSLDTLQQNFTTDRLVPPQQFNPDAALTISQAFHEQTAAVGDVVTLLVTAQNITDSVRVDSVTVAEWTQPALDFVSSPDFVLEDGRLVWRAGALGGGRAKTAVIKFVANGRVTSGKAKAVGNVSGVAETGDPVRAGPAVSTIRLANDVFASEGVVFGEVYVDENGNGRRDRGEAGTAGLGVFLDSGEYALTDSLGKFSLPRAFAGWRTVRLDEGTVPAGLEFFEPLGGREGARRENERLIHLLRGGNANVSFRLRRIPPPTVEVGHAVTCQEQVSIARFARLYETFVMPDLHFGLGKAGLTMDAARQLRPVVEFLFEHPDWGVFLEGHTDSIPIHTEAFPSNYELSIARAGVLRSFFDSMGIDSTRIVVQGYGESRPRATNETIEGRQLNRRVEVSLIPPGVWIEDGKLHRVSATVKDLRSLPDTFKVDVRWEFSTTCERPCDATLRLDLPYQIRSADVRVTMDGTRILPRDGVFVLDGFAKSRAARCEIAFRAVNGDTAYVRDIEAVIEMNDAAPADGAGVADVSALGVPGGASVAKSRSKRFSVSIRPDQEARIGVSGRSWGLLSWRETVPVSGVRSDGELPAGGSGPDSAALAGGERPASEAVNEAAAEGGGAGLAILEPMPDAVLTRTDQVRLRARVPLGARTTVFVGGEELPEGHMGHKAVHVGDGFEEITWFAVRIRPGWNTIFVRSVLLDGTTVGDSVRVALAARPAVVEAQRKRVLVPADGRTRGVVQFRVWDELGLPVADGITATVEEGDSLVANDDARPQMPGLQVASRSGFFSLDIRPSNDTGMRTVTIECNGIRASTVVSYVSATRPMLATGVVDLRLGKYDTGGEGNPEGLENYEDGVSAGADARVFLQATLPYDVGVTARLDTENRDEEPHLKDVNPELQYPIYGDESELHFAAPSQTGNYVSFDKGESFVRYGDFRTPLTTGEYLYYHQVATGVTGALVGGDGAVRGFVTDSDYATYRDEIESDGTSGFYYLEHAPVVLNSERIFLETRDRFQSEIILDLKPQVRNRDYTINPFDGSILFKEPIPVTDRHLNPIYIMVVYEVETTGASQPLFGLRGDLVGSRQRGVGVTAVANTGDGERYALYGADGRVNLSGVTVAGEIARSENDAIGNGNAYRIEAGVDNRVTETSVYFRRVDEDYNNPSFIRGSQELGTRKTGFKSRVRLSPEISFIGDGYIHDLRRVDEKRSSVLFGGDYRRTSIDFFAGARVAGEEDADRDNSGVLSVLGLSADVPSKLEVRSRWEQNLGSEWVQDYPNRLTTLVGVPFSKRLRVTATHEYLSADGRPGTNQLQAGIESRLASRTTAYTRYSMNRTASDARMGAVAGLRQAFQIRAGVTATAALEGYQSMTDSDADEYLSIKTGLAARRSDSHVFETRYEYRWEPTRSKHLVQLIASAQLQSGFSLLLNDVVSYTPDSERESGLNYHGKLGLAYRPIGVPVQSLFALKNLYEKYTPVNPDAITWKLILSADVNVLPAVRHELRLKYAHKRVEDLSYGISVNTDTDLALGQYIYRFARCWDVDLWGRILAQHGGTTETGAGVEIGRLFFRTVRVAGGYSAGGFDEPDISGTDAWARGFGVRIQLILSDWIMQEFGGM